MDSVLDQLAANLLGRVKTTLPQKRILIGLCGVPGSGKSLLAEKVVQKVNAAFEQFDIATWVSMDGWHFSRAQLEKMPDPELAKDKRGAIWTFDGKAFSNFVISLHESTRSEILWAPSFSHTRKDPVPKDIAILPQHQIIILEGLYANVDEGEFAKAARLYDERWMINCDEELMKARLIARHVASGVSKDFSEAEWRANCSDIPNGRYLLEHVLEPVLRINTVEEGSWKAS